MDFPFLFRFSAFWRTKLQDVFNNSLYKHIQSTSRNRPGNFKEISALMFASKFNYLLMILRMRLMHLNRYTCYIFVHYINIWSNYSDLTRPHPKWWFSKGDPLISGKSRLVKYNNLARNIYRYLISRDMHYIKYIQLDLYFLIQNTSIFANMYTNTRWFKVTFLSPNVEGHLAVERVTNHHPKKVRFAELPGTCVYIQCITLPETNVAPESRPPQ